jgi:hypothetical protein
MRKAKTLRTLLPAETQHTVQSSEAGAIKEMRRNNSLACTECQVQYLPTDQDAVDYLVQMLG